MNKKKGISRRDFVRNSSVLGASVLATGMGVSHPGNRQPGVEIDQEKKETDLPKLPARAMIGIQAGVGSVAKMGAGPFLDDIQQRGAVNTVFLFSWSYIASRTGIDMQTFHGGNFANIDEKFYKGLPIKFKDLRSPDFGTTDFLATLIPEAKKRNIKIFPWVLEDNRRPLHIEGMDKLYEIDLYGRRATSHPSGPCYNNPYYQQLMLGTLEDYVRNYDIEGTMWGAERQGPLGNALGAYHNGAGSDPGKVGCFCEYCIQKARQQGIDVERVKEGFKRLETYVKNGRAGKQPIDGYYVEFWKVLLQHPEILAWQNFWNTNMRAFQQNLYKKVKSVNPAVQMGFHIWHNISFNPLYRAEQDYSLYVPYSDYVKPVLYNNCAGERMVQFVDSIGQNMLGDLKKQEILQFEYEVMNYNEKPYDQLAGSAFSSEYVKLETKRAKDSLAGNKTLVWPGVDIDVPGRASTPESVKSAVQAAFKGGADGILLSRNYGEMKPENLSSAGAAVREMGSRD